MEGSAHATIRRLKRAEYLQLADLGAFENENVELLDGFIVHRAAETVPHADLVMRFNERVVKALPHTAQLWPRLPFALSDYSMPEPDFAIVPRRPFGAGYPSASPWLVEVAGSSLGIDRELKMRLYAEAGVREYWIVNADEVEIEVHRDPAGKRYGSVQTYDRFARIAPLAFPDLVVCLDDLIGAAGS